MIYKIRLSIALILTVLSTAAHATTITTNSVVIENAPSWLTDSKIQDIVDRVEMYLEWSIHRTKATFYSDQAQFIAKFNGRAASDILAFTKRNDLTIHLGPLVTKETFEGVFAHELSHVILFQKYKDAIPPWLTEGLCNSVGGIVKVNYVWLASQKERVDVTTLQHPYDKQNKNRADLHYRASLAVVKMLQKKCPDFKELLNLSLKSKLADYLPTYCGIEDLNGTFWKFVDSEAKKESQRSTR
ncbi:MAG: hypothetical protein ABIR96_00495 [Bdellovibrionota bacterium]